MSLSAEDQFHLQQMVGMVAEELGVSTDALKRMSTEEFNAVLERMAERQMAEARAEARMAVVDTIILRRVAEVMETYQVSKEMTFGEALTAGFIPAEAVERLSRESVTDEEIEAELAKLDPPPL